MSSSPFSQSYFPSNEFDFSGLTNGDDRDTLRNRNQQETSHDRNGRNRDYDLLGRVQMGDSNFTRMQYVGHAQQFHDNQDILLCCVSREIRKLDTQIEDLQNQNTKLMRRLNDIETLVQDSHTKLLSAIQTVQTTATNTCKTVSPSNVASTTLSASLPSASLPLPCLDQDDYVNIKFWFKSAYLVEKKKRKAYSKLEDELDTNGNIMTWYLEDEDGDPVDGAKVEQVRATARSLWETLKSRGIAPSTWSEANNEAHNYYEAHLCERHPEVSYCENNWKAHQIAIDSYPSWSKVHLRAKIKKEFRLERQAKRAPSSELSTRAAKKARTVNVDAQPTGATASVTTKLTIMDPLANVFPTPTIQPTPSLVLPPATSELRPPSAPPLAASSPASAENSLPIEPSTSSTSGSDTSTTRPPSEPSPILPSQVLPPPEAPVPPVPHVSPPPSPSHLPQAPRLPPIRIAARSGEKPPPVTSEPAAAGTSTTEPALNRKSKKAKAGAAKNPKSICKRWWIKNNPAGLEDEFGLFWEGLSPDALQKLRVLADSNKELDINDTL
ncbi:hypothetical protein H0H92_002348 [Tricholoma furcatifolium]|nr:hypothetical protein H0H92_002348 [Tricholoma furcatifolium]